MKRPKNEKPDILLSRETILEALSALSDQLGEQGIDGEVCLFGGTAMVLAYSAGVSKKDVDALFQPAQTIRKLARQIAEERSIFEEGLA